MEIALSGQTGEAKEFGLFGFREGRESTFRKFPEKDVLDADTFEAFDLVAGGLDHPADLPVLSLGEDDGEFSGRDTIDVGRLRLVSVKNLDSGGHLGELGIRDGPVGFDDVFLFVFVTRVHEPVGEPAVIGEDEQASGILVEPADREDPLRNIDDVENANVVFGYASRDDSAGFVDLIIDELFGLPDGFVAYLDDVDPRRYGDAEFGNLPINGNETPEDEFFGFSAGSDAIERQVLLKAHPAVRRGCFG